MRAELRTQVRAEMEWENKSGRFLAFPEQVWFTPLLGTVGLTALPHPRLLDGCRRPFLGGEHFVRSIIKRSVSSSVGGRSLVQWMVGLYFSGWSVCLGYILQQLLLLWPISSAF